VILNLLLCLLLCKGSHFSSNRFTVFFYTG